MALFTGTLPWPSRSGLDDDGALVARLADGDEAALTGLYERHAGAVLAYLRQLTGDREEAEELLQDTFVAAWRAAPGFAGRSGARTWLFGIARRRARDGRRRHRVPLAGPSELGGLLARGGEDVALARLELGELARLAARLPAAHREVLALALVHELPLSEVARLLDVPVGTVKSRLSAARRALQSLAADSARQGRRP